MFANTRHWGRLVLWLIVIKVGYLAAISSAAWLWPAFDEEKFYVVKARWPREAPPVFASHFATWDGAHYLYLSELGYKKDLPSCAFYPLWPLVVHWFSTFTASSHLIAAMVLANVFSLGGWVVFYHVSARRFGDTVALWALVFMAAFPGSL